jgi:hypothetical protein
MCPNLNGVSLSCGIEVRFQILSNEKSITRLGANVEPDGHCEDCWTPFYHYVSPVRPPQRRCRVFGPNGDTAQSTRCTIFPAEVREHFQPVSTKMTCETRWCNSWPIKISPVCAPSRYVALMFGRPELTQRPAFRAEHCTVDQWIDDLIYRLRRWSCTRPQQSPT